MLYFAYLPVTNNQVSIISFLPIGISVCKIRVLD